MHMQAFDVNPTHSFMNEAPGQINASVAEN